MNNGNKAALAGALALMALSVGWWLLPPLPPTLPDRPVRGMSTAPTALPGGDRSARATRVPSAADLPSRNADEPHACDWPGLLFDKDGNVIDSAEAVEAASRNDETRAKVVAALESDPRPRSQAVAVMFQLRGLTTTLMKACTDGDCESAAALSAALASIAPRRLALVDALASAAVTTADPQVYAWALDVCGTGQKPAGGPCAQLSIARWAQLDPDNSRPWMAALATAREQGTDSAVDEALHRIASAKRDDVGWTAILGTVMDHTADEDDRPAGTLAVLSEAIGLQAGQGLSHYSALTKACSIDALQDPNRAQLCSGAATTLLERSDTRVARSIALAIGRRLAWPEERMDQLRGEEQAYDKALNDEIGSPSGRSTDEAACTAMRRVVSRLRSIAHLSEVGALRDWVARSGRPASDYANLGRKTRIARDEWATAAAATASAAAAASAALAR